MWTYFGVEVFPADANGSGIRWYARTPASWGEAPTVLKADSKASMRHLIRHYRPSGAR